MTKCDVCGEREQTRGGFISGDSSGPSITRTCDECHKLTFEEAKKRQRSYIHKLAWQRKKAQEKG